MYPLFAGIKGMGDITAGRLLGELGDDSDRFASQKSVRAFAETSPGTKQSGGTKFVKRRHVKNNRLNHAAFMWAFTMLKASPGARTITTCAEKTATSTPQRCGTCRTG